MRSIYLSTVAAIFFVALQAGAANAQSPSANVPNVTPPVPSPSSGDRPELFGSVTITTDNRSQGFTSRGEDPSFDADIGVIWHNFYVGISGSLVDLGRTPSGRKIGNKSISYFAGYVNVWRDITYDIGITYNTNPGALDANAELDYWEANVGVSRVMFRDLKLGARVYFSSDYTANQGDNWIFEVSLEQPLPKFDRFSPVFTATLGYQDGDERRNNFDYWFWEAGVEVTVTENLNFDLRYHDTADVPFDCTNQCGPAFVASMTIEY